LDIWFYSGGGEAPNCEKSDLHRGRCARGGIRGKNARRRGPEIGD